MVRALGKEINCDQFGDYLPGRGPKELDAMNTHQAAIAMQEKLLALQQNVFDWRQQQADRDGQFAKQIQALEDARHQENRSDSKAISRRELWVMGVVTVIASIVGGAVSAWLTSPRP